MKIIQSFWARPSFDKQEDYLNDRKIGGWFNYKYFLLSSAFSCLSLSRIYKKVELYTDSIGYDIYIKQLKLPYTDVHLTLNELINENSKLWILGKILAIKLQSEPFIHVDNDVFTWAKFTTKKSKYLFAQSEGLTPNVYLDTLDDIRKEWEFIPNCLRDWPTIANVGVIGGNDIDFFSKFCQLSDEILNKNKNYINASSNGYINQMLEEYLFTCLAKERNYKIDFLLNIDRTKHPTDQFTRFHLTPMVDKYVHLIGSMKQNLYACEQIEVRMKKEFPMYYKIINNLLNEKFPSLTDSKYSFQIKRLNKLGKAIEKLYSFSIMKFLDLKLVLSKDVKVFENINSDKMQKFYIVEKNILTGLDQSRELVGLENLIPLFETPCSINELLKLLELEYQDKYAFNNQNIIDLKLNLIDIIAKEVFMNLTLSIV